MDGEQKQEIKGVWRLLVEKSDEREWEGKDDGDGNDGQPPPEDREAVRRTTTCSLFTLARQLLFKIVMLIY